MNRMLIAMSVIVLCLVAFTGSFALSEFQTRQGVTGNRVITQELINGKWTTISQAKLDQVITIG